MTRATWRNFCERVYIPESKLEQLTDFAVPLRLPGKVFEPSWQNNAAGGRILFRKW